MVHSDVGFYSRIPVVARARACARALGTTASALETTCHNLPAPCVRHTVHHDTVASKRESWISELSAECEASGRPV
jgi:hypothetical protein